MAARLRNSTDVRHVRKLRMGHDFVAFVFGRPARRQLPERVRTAIAHQQVQAEILTGWTQFALVLFFLPLHTIARKPPDALSRHPVPYVLPAFLLFTPVRL